jgi:hypothetical protein
MKKTLLLSATALLLSACSQAGSGPDRLPAGRWEATASLDTIDAPGLPEAQKEQLRQMMAQQMKSQASAQCYRDDGGDQLKQMRDSLTAGANQGGANMECQFGNGDRMSGGVMRVEATCRPPGAPMQIRTKVDGTYTADAMDATMEVFMEGTQPGGEQRQIRLTGKLTGRRVGDC